MGNTPLREIDTNRSRNTLGNADFADGKPINGLDSETADGDIFQLGCYYGDSGEFRYIGDSEEPVSGLEVLDFLTSGGMRGALNIWFNLNFDANVILKALPKENIRELRMHNTTEFDSTESDRTWTITYIPKKCLEIRDDNKNVYRHFDAMQFAYNNLEGAAEDWLGVEDGKLDENIDVEQFGLKENGKLNDYTQRKYDEILEYLKRDCELTAEIFEEIVDTAESQVDPPIPFGKPYSTGYVAADYIRNRLEHKPGYANVEMQEAAWKTYRGGRFEIMKRGDVGEVYGADINSAYPWVMSELPDPSSLKWGAFGDGRLNAMDMDMVEDADYGFVKIRATTDASRPIQPFAIKNERQGGRVEYPALEDAEIWTLLPIYRFAKREGYFEECDVQEAILGFETPSTNYPYDFFKDLYSRRKTLEERGRDKPAKLLKIVMNSMYGKTCQTNTKYEPVEDGLSLEEMEEMTGTFVTDERGKGYREYQEAGRLFNPFIATYITGLTRLKLHETVVENGLEDDTVMLATDCIMVEADAFEGTDLHERAEKDVDDYRDALGGWDYDYVGEAFVIGSGVYEVETEKGYKRGVRGFKDLFSDENDFETLREAAQNHPEGIPVKNARPVTIGDIMHVNGDLSDVGKFKKTERTLTPDMDGKRRWNDDSPTFGDLLESPEGSEPKVYDGSFRR